jgi:hypothetical protein
MTQELLNRSQVGTPLQQVSGESMAQCVRAYPFSPFQTAEKTVHNPADSAIAQPPSSHTQEKGISFRFALDGVAGKLRPLFIEISLEQLPGGIMHRDNTFLSPLAYHSHLLSLEINIGQIQLGQLPYAHAGGVE